MDRSFLLFINFFCCCFRLPHPSAFSRTSASRTSRVNLEPRPESFPKVGGFPSSPLHRLAALAQQLQPSSFSETDTDQLRRSSHGASESVSYQDFREAKGQRPPRTKGLVRSADRNLLRLLVHRNRASPSPFVIPHYRSSCSLTMSS